MNFLQLKYFCTLAEQNHYTKVAEKLNTTQPNISHAIHKLEEELGLPLFEKVGRNMRLTKYGKILYEDVQPILAALDETEKHMKEVREGEECLNIGFPSVLGLDYIPKICKEFQDEQGGKVTFHIQEKNSNFLDEMLETNQSEVIFSTGTKLKGNYQSIPVLHKYLYVIVPKKHPLAKLDSVTVEEIAEYPMILFRKDSGIRYAIDRMFTQAKLSPNIAMEITEDQVIAGFVAEGFGIAIVEDIPVLETLPIKKIKLESNAYSQTFYMVWNEESHSSRVLNEFIEHVKKHTKL